MKKFIILFEGRSGSSMLVNKMSQLPDVYVEGEAFTQKHLKTKEKQEAYYKKLYLKNKVKSAVGFKTKVRDVIDLDYLYEFILDNDLYVIQLLRDNIVKQTISRITGRKRVQLNGEWNRKEGQEPIEPFEISLEDFEKELIFRRDMNNLLVDFCTRIFRGLIDKGIMTERFMVVKYADLLKDEEEIMKSICYFLDVDYQPTKSQIIKNTPDDLSKIITNFSALRSEYVGTDLEKMFDEIVVDD